MKTKNLFLTTIATLVFIAGAHTQNVWIPDANFKAALVSNLSINSNMDAEIQITEAAAFTGGINVSNSGISDLTGIEAFVALDSLDCSINHISGLELWANIALTYIDCSGNMEAWEDPNLPMGNGNNVFVYYMDSLDVSANTSLTTLKCSSNGLLSLNVSGASALSYLDCSSNQRFVCDVNWGSVVPISTPIFNFLSNAALTTLNCRYNGLASLDVTGNTLLTYLNCSWNQLPSINVAGNTLLTTLNCRYNILTTLDVSNLIVLALLDCGQNELTNLDVSANTALANLDCSYSAYLTSLNVKNGNNMSMWSFIASYNPYLSCIEVDSAAWSTANWSNYIDPTAYFSENCSGVGILDNNLSTVLQVYPNPTTGAICLSEKGDVSLSDLSGKLLLEQENINQMDISSLPAGIYFLSVGENKQQTFKIIKE